MASNNKNVYHGKNRFRSLITAVILVVAIVLVAGVALFFWLQRYIEYTEDGLYLALPWNSQEEAPDTGNSQGIGEEGPAVIVIEDPDYSDIETSAGEDLPVVRALYVPADGITESSLTNYSMTMSSDADALVLCMKPGSGQLSWKSGVELAAAFGANGTFDISETVSALKEKNIYLIAELSCCVDEIMATRNTPLALKTEAGGIYSDSRGSWLDPYNREARQYITDLMAELAEMGFDEVLLTNLEHPVTEVGIVYSQELTSPGNPVACVSGFALTAWNAAGELGIRVSILANADSMRSEASDRSGQDLSQLSAFADRFFVRTSSGYYESDRASIQAAVGASNMDTRFVPVLGYSVGDGSWMIE